ncbi:MAG: hypothetical protein EOP34_01920 [Rickettsiales bacterium]|nr:MAG: hypothetical protein EOP34_01920 [Rickettsiales bacterium]
MQYQYGFGVAASNRIVVLAKQVNMTPIQLASTFHRFGLGEGEIFARPDFDNGYVVAPGTTNPYVLETRGVHRNHEIAMKASLLLRLKYRNLIIDNNNSLKFKPFDYTLLYGELKHLLTPAEKQYIWERTRSSKLEYHANNLNYSTGELADKYALCHSKFG